MWPDHKRRRARRSHTRQQGCLTACQAHARQLGHVVEAIMAIINLTMRSPKPAAAGGSDRQLPHVVTVSGSALGRRSAVTSLILLLAAQHVCVVNRATSCVCLGVCVCVCDSLLSPVWLKYRMREDTRLCGFQTPASSSPTALWQKGKDRSG